MLESKFFNCKISTNCKGSSLNGYNGATSFLTSDLQIKLYQLLLKMTHQGIETCQNKTIRLKHWFIDINYIVLMKKILSVNSRVATLPSLKAGHVLKS